MSRSTANWRVPPKPASATEPASPHISPSNVHRETWQRCPAEPRVAGHQSRIKSLCECDVRSVISSQIAAELPNTLQQGLMRMPYEWQFNQVLKSTLCSRLRELGPLDKTAQHAHSCKAHRSQANCMRYSHSIVAGGLLVMSKTTRLT